MKILSWSRRWSSASCFWMDLPDRGLIAAHGRDVVSAGPKALAREVLPPPEVGPGDVNGTLAFHIPDHLGHRILRGNGDQHVDVVHLEVPLLHRTFALLGQVAEHRAQGPCGARHTGPCAGTWESRPHGTLHSHLVWAKLSLSSMEASWDCVSFERFTA